MRRVTSPPSNEGWFKGTWRSSDLRPINTSCPKIWSPLPRICRKRVLQVESYSRISACPPTSTFLSSLSTMPHIATLFMLVFTTNCLVEVLHSLYYITLRYEWYTVLSVCLQDYIVRSLLPASHWMRMSDVSETRRKMQCKPHLTSFVKPNQPAHSKKS